VSTGQRQQYLECNGFIAPISTQTAASREIGIITHSTYSLNIDTQGKGEVPRAGDYVKVVDIFERAGWVRDLEGVILEITDVAGMSIPGWYRLMLRETRQ